MQKPAPHACINPPAPWAGPARAPGGKGGSPLRVVLRGGAPHQRVLQLADERVVDLAAQVLQQSAAAVRRQHHRLRKVGLVAHLRGVKEKVCTMGKV